MKAYHLSIIGTTLSLIGIVLLFTSYFITDQEIYFDAFDAYFITSLSILLKIAACLFLLAAFIFKIIKSIQSFK